MRIQVRLILFLISFSLLIVFSVIGYNYITFKQKKNISRLNSESHNEVIDKVIRLRSEQFEDFARDYSGWDEMLHFSKTIDNEWARLNIDPSLYTYKLSFWAVFNQQNKLIYTFNDTLCEYSDFKLLQNNLDKIFEKKHVNHFYLFSRGKLYDIMGATIVPSEHVNIRDGIEAQGYMFVAREWNSKYVNDLEIAVNFKILICEGICDQPLKKLDSLKFNINRWPLISFDQKTVGNAYFIRADPLNRELNSLYSATTYFALVVIVALVLFFIFFNIFFYRPLRNIILSLTKEDKSYLDKIKNRKDEFSRIAELLEVSLDHDALLKDANSKLVSQNEEILSQKELLEEAKDELMLMNRELWFQTHALNESDVVTITDAEGRITYANDNFCKISGFSQEELIGNSHRIMKSDVHSQEFFKQLWHTIAVEKKNWRGEICNISKDGQYKWFESFIVPFLNDKNYPYQFLAIRFDITEKKKTEQENQRKSEELLQQKKAIEQITNEILSSLEYARNIQTALLPSEEFISQILPDHFVMFLPLEIVSGDFYWFNIYKEKLLIAVADCTGHGVPGAMMSMLGISFLNDIYRSHEYVESHLILNELRKRVIQNLHQTDEIGKHKDGMDIALGIINLETEEFEYSGAFNPIVIVRKESNELSGFEVNSLNGYTAHMIKGDRMPIGYHYGSNSKSFTRHTFKLMAKDTIYFFSDGFVDQNGGGDNKKFRINNFINTLLQIQEEEMQVQQLALNQVLNDWMGEHHQVDDILVVGVRYH